MLYRLIVGAFAEWSKFNSVYVMQPLYLLVMNEAIFMQIGIIDQSYFDLPAPSPKMTSSNARLLYLPS